MTNLQQSGLDYAKACVSDARIAGPAWQFCASLTLPRSYSVPDGVGHLFGMDDSSNVRCTRDGADLSLDTDATAASAFVLLRLIEDVEQRFAVQVAFLRRCPLPTSSWQTVVFRCECPVPSAFGNCVEQQAHISCGGGPDDAADSPFSRFLVADANTACVGSARYAQGYSELFGALSIRFAQRWSDVCFGALTVRASSDGVVASGRVLRRESKGDDGSRCTVLPRVRSTDCPHGRVHGNALCMWHGLGMGSAAWGTRFWKLLLIETGFSRAIGLGWWCKTSKCMLGGKFECRHAIKLTRGN